ncbi:DUF4846 domain-containing protein [Ferruginibacter lapsinanis]|uniref:DUF4846 domain-containing protein n=1 Tax=Ferruginibacter lapsinanis TaxID=563172 RepID=UPI001E2F55A8|nr:DUF4846 domain-containing protein [Ferruginibacter lapsinanis]UEG49274.1 DUF4846 domain-containing protein [Ferruginibacter lapsinanis]
MRSKPILLFISSVSLSCTENHVDVTRNIQSNVIKVVSEDINPYTSIGKIPLPPGFVRLEKSKDSFATWLRNIKLKKDKTVFLYNGNVKKNQSAQFAVLDISVDKKDLQQCADAMMRLRAEYLFNNNKFDEIVFTDNAGTKYQFRKPYTKENFNNYLTTVFGMCGSASLSKQLKNIAIRDIDPGDVFIRGGFPGHAVMVIDVATNAQVKKIYLLAQSYMPAQDIHVLINPVNAVLSPWYMVNEDEDIITPEYYFKKNELKRW